MGMSSKTDERDDVIDAEFTILNNGNVTLPVPSPQALKNALMNDEPIHLGPGGRVIDQNGVNLNNSNEPLVIPRGKLANVSEREKKKNEDLRQRIKQMMLNDEPIQLNPGGTVVNQNGERVNDSNQPLVIPKGKLAAIIQWYQREPDRFHAEVAAMKMAFPQFTYRFLPDGRMAWTGKVRPGVLGANGWDWTLEAIYDNNHPSNSNWGGSVHVYLRKPSIDQLISMSGWRPHHLIGSGDGTSLCTSRQQDYSIGRGCAETSAASVLLWAVKWLMCYELVLSGEMSRSEFDHM